MPSDEYQWLTDRERAYLDDPESVDEQTRAELRYRLRTKYSATIDGVRRLLAEPEVWDVRERDGDERVRCGACGDACVAPRYRYRETGVEVVEPADWHAHPDDGIDAWFCAACWRSLRDREAAVEQGRVPCAGADCSAHTFHSRTLRECVARGNVAFSTDELDDLQDAWRDRRERVCPDCGTPADEIDDGEFETHMGEYPPGHPDAHVATGLVCECGWQGFRGDLALRKR